MSLVGMGEFTVSLGYVGVQEENSPAKVLKRPANIFLVCVFISKPLLTVIMAGLYGYLSRLELNPQDGICRSSFYFPFHSWKVFTTIIKRF